MAAIAAARPDSTKAKFRVRDDIDAGHPGHFDVAADVVDVPTDRGEPENHVEKYKYCKCQQQKVRYSERGTIDDVQQSIARGRNIDRQRRDKQRKARQDAPGT